MAVFVFCAMILAAQRWAVRMILTQAEGILPVYTLTDMKALIVCTVIILIMAVAETGFAPVFVTIGMLILWNGIQIFRLNRLTSQAVETMAFLKEYELKTLKIYYSQKHRGFNHDDYSFYAPVMCYEINGFETEILSCVWSQNMNCEKETEYQIYYSAMNPELFWFPEQKNELTLPYVTGLCISAAFFVGLLALYFSV